MASVIGQSQPPGQLIVEEDTLHRGGPLTRNAATLKVSTGWVAYLDDDDYWYPTHLEVLWRAAQDTGADVVYPWMTGNDPWPDRFGRAWDSDHPYLFPICYLAKTQVVVDAGAFDHVSLYGHEIVAGEDWPQILRMAGHRPDENGEWHRVEPGAKIVHHPERTWHYRAHALHFSGLPQKVPWGLAAWH